MVRNIDATRLRLPIREFHWPYDGVRKSKEKGRIHLNPS